jgi:hypothetical protein
MDFDKFQKELDEWMASDEAKVYFKKEADKQMLKESRYLRFEEWIKHNNFDTLMYRLILEHGEDWNRKCNDNGFEAFPNNKLQFVLDYVFHNQEPIRVKKIEAKHFPSQTYLFKGYYFQITQGQGCIIDIYNAEDYRLLLRI